MLDPLGSTFTEFLFDPMVQRLRHLRDMQETRVQLHPGSLAEFSPPATPCEAGAVWGDSADGLMVQMGRRRLRKAAIRVRFPVSPLRSEGSRIRLAGPVCSTVRSCGREGSNPSPSAVAGFGVGFRKQIVTLRVGGSIPPGHPRVVPCSGESPWPLRF